MSSRGQYNHMSQASQMVLHGYSSSLGRAEMERFLDTLIKRLRKLIQNILEQKYISFWLCSVLEATVQQRMLYASHMVVLTVNFTPEFVSLPPFHTEETSSKAITFTQDCASLSLNSDAFKKKLVLASLP
jgi:hypothetical protein